MINLHLASLEELEALCDQDLVNLYRQSYPDPTSYREALVKYLSQPELPLEELFRAIRETAEPAQAWLQVLEVCRRAVPTAPWNTLPYPHVKDDIATAKKWLEKQLHSLPIARGIYLGLDTLNMNDGQGTNLSIGSSVSCDPFGDSVEWAYDELFHGTEHLIRGLYELKAIYTQAEWQVDDEKIVTGNYAAFADYMIFLGYSGIVLGHAFKQISADRTRLAVWGFHDDDLFLLGRHTLDGFSFLCQ